MRQFTLPLKDRLQNLNYFYILVICLLSGVGLLMLYDAGGGHMQPWALPQLIRFSLGMVCMLAIAITPIKFWLKYAYGFYFVSLALLVLVALFGHIGMGAQRWLNLYVIKLQPSELMRISLVLALACYFHRMSLEETRQFSLLIPPLCMILLPVLLVLKQPDLGTALLLMMIGISMLFVAGVKLRYFIMGLIGFVSFIPLAWHFLLHDYQKRRVLTFLNPENDPLGSGYHIMQSKIALGSGGFFGKGFMKGTQSHLNFLPEKQTDFIFTMFCEEFGMMGALGLLFLYTLLVSTGFIISLRIQNKFGRLVSFGVTLTMLTYVVINMAMVMGLVPVVGIPLPMVSYGGTAMITLMMGFGLLLNADLYRDGRLPRY